MPPTTANTKGEACQKQRHLHVSNAVDSKAKQEVGGTVAGVDPENTPLESFRMISSVERDGIVAKVTGLHQSSIASKKHDTI